MFFNYKKIPITIDNQNILATDVSIQVSNNSQPSYKAGERYSFLNSVNDSVTSNISLSYYLTGLDLIKTRFIEDRNLNLTENLIVGNIAGLNFKSGFLTNYTINGEPNSPIVVNAEIAVFDDLQGNLQTFFPQFYKTLDYQPLNTSDCQLTIHNTDATNYSNVLSFNYSYSAEVRPHYVTSNVSGFVNLLPHSVRYGQKQIVTNIVTDDTSGNLALKSDKLAIGVSFRDKNQIERESIYTSGLLTNKNINVQAGGIAANTLTIRQDYIQEAPSITSISHLDEKPGGFIFIFGNNLYPTTNVFFGDKKSDYFDQKSQNAIRVQVPKEVISGYITVDTFGGSTTWGTPFIPSDPGIQINALSSTETQNQVNNGEFYSFEGNNFYSLSNVYFDDIDSDFIRINNKNIKAKVPDDFTKGKIKIVSSIRNVTGISPDEIQANPKIISFSPQTGIINSEINIQGRNFTGVNSITFNNIEVDSFSVDSNTQITTYVPSGLTFGPIRVYQDNQSQTISPYYFKPAVLITGISPSSGKATDPITISGFNFYDEILQKASDGNILVDFNGGVTGFYLTSSIEMTGRVPYNASSGPIKIYSFDNEANVDNFDFSNEALSEGDVGFIKRNDPPEIKASTESLQGGFKPWTRPKIITSYIYPRTFKRNTTVFNPPSGPRGVANYFSVEGKNFFDVNYAEVSGLATSAVWRSNGSLTGVDFQPNYLGQLYSRYDGPNLKVDVLGTKMNVVIPMSLPADEYVVKVDCLEGFATGDYRSRITIIP